MVFVCYIYFVLYDTEAMEEQTYSRREVARISGLTVVQLNKLHQDGVLVAVADFGSRPVYTWTQVLQATALAQIDGDRASKRLAMQAMKAMERSMSGQYLIVYGGQAVWSPKDRVAAVLVQLTTQRQGLPVQFIGFDEVSIRARLACSTLVA